MFQIPFVCLISLVAPGSALDVAKALHVDVLAGNVRVLAGETWLGLAPGCELPDSGPSTTLSLDWNARARLTIAGAGVDLRGPLEVESTLTGAWTVRMNGRGAAQVNVRSTALRIELASSARLDLERGVYWIEGVPAGGWRVGCDAGVPLILRPLEGRSWGRSAEVENGASLRLVPTQVAPPPSAQAGRRLALPAWTSFSWPWTSPAART